jgi:hypothetical protein
MKLKVLKILIFLVQLLNLMMEISIVVDAITYFKKLFTCVSRGLI